jgi:hypothetical protein
MRLQTRRVWVQIVVYTQFCTSYSFSQNYATPWFYIQGDNVKIYGSNQTEWLVLLWLCCIVTSRKDQGRVPRFRTAVVERQQQGVF